MVNVDVWRVSVELFYVQCLVNNGQTTKFLSLQSADA